MRNERIAIVGIGVRYPDAASPRELWDNVCAGRRACRPSDDREKATDGHARRLALDTAAAALADAGLPDSAHGHTVDGLGSSPLLTVVHAAEALLAGDLDVAIAGSVDPFDVLGAGMVVLMREADAIASHHRIYASIAGWGVTSDGTGGGTLAGQRRALTRAYEHAGYGVETVSYFEGRGATTEIYGLSAARRDADPTAPPAALGTVGGTFGTVRAAGMAGLIKAALAVHHQVIPPGTGHHSKLVEPDAAVRAPADAALWPADAPVRAGVSATGAGGVHTHLALEEAPGRERRTGIDSWTAALAAGRQDTELLMVDADTATDLAARLTHLADHVATMTFAQLTDVAGALAIRLGDGTFRAAVVAADPTSAARGLRRLAAELAEGRDTLLSPTDGVFLAHRTTAPRIAYLFPGEATGRPPGGALRRRFATAEHLYGMAATGEALVVAGSTAGLRVLQALGIDADIAVGHGLGELTALSWAGGLDGGDLLRLAAMRAEVMAEDLVTVGASGAGPMAERLADVRLHPLRKPVVSTVFGRAPGATTEVAEAIAGADLAIEVGPGRALTGLVADSARDTLLLSMDTDSPSMAPLLTVAGATFVLGADIDLTTLFADRVIRPITVDADPVSTVDSTPAGKTTLDVLRSLTAARGGVPLATVTEQTDPLDDLLLAPHTVRRIVDDAARALGRPPLPATTNLATVTLGDLAGLVDQPTADISPPREIPGYAPWVRPFAVTYVPTDRPAPLTGTPGTWSLHAPTGHPYAERLRAALTEARLGDGVLLCLPADGSAHGDLIARAGRAAARTGPNTRFVLVQQDFGAAGLARTLHGEHPSLRTTVITLAGGAPADAAVVGDVAATTGYTEVRYTEDGVRTVPVLRALNPVAGNPPLTSADVLLVTDGALGITAECALVMAQDSGARLAVLGSTDPGADDPLWHHLTRMIGAGVETRYARADLTSAEEVRHAVDTLEAALGPVTAVLHGAGRTEPTALADLTGERLRQTVAPTVDGLRTVLASVGEDNVKLLVTVGSVLGRTGLAEAHHATATDWLTGLTVDFGRRHRAARALAIEWPSWSNPAEARDGVAPISPEDGRALLRRVLADPSAGPVLVVGGRMADLPTITVEQPATPVDGALVHYPGVELITEVTLSAGDEPLIPATLGMTAMTEAAVALTGSEVPPLLADVAFLRPIVVAPNTSTTVRVVALAVTADTVSVAIRTEETGFETDHVRATVRFPQTAPISLPVNKLPALSTVTALSGCAARALESWAPSLLGPYLEQATEAVLGGARTVVVEPDQAIGPLAPLDRLARTELATSRALSRLGGRARLDGAALATSHAAGLTVVVVGAGRLACDVTVVAGHPLLSGPQRPVRDRVAAETGEPVSVAATRVLSALACQRKSGLSTSSTLTLDQVDESGWVVLTDGESRIATWVTTVDGVREQVVFTVLSGTTDLAAHYESTGDESWT